MIRNILHRPIAVTMALIAIVTLGILSLGRIPVSLMPDIDIPRIIVQMSSPGSSAREIEQRMVTPMRQQLSQVAGLKDIESISRMDGGTITLSFEPGSDMSLIFIEVNEKIDRAMNSMPKEMERPKVMKMGALDIPAFYIDISSVHQVTSSKKQGEKDSPSDGAHVPMHELSRLAKNVISKRIEQLPEVAMVDLSGMVGTQISVIPNASMMSALGMTNSDIERAISDNNIILEALSVRDGIYRYTIHFDSQILSVEDIEDIYIRHEGRLLQLKDIAEVKEHPSPRNGNVRSSGKDAITLAVIKQNDAQMSDLQQNISSLLEDMKADYPDLAFEVTRDQTRLLTYSMQNLEWNLVLGAVMACFVLFVFLGGWRLPLLVTISIPISLILTLLCFYLIGISMNIISLSGLILGVGMIVDNAIIVIDNIRQKQTIADCHAKGTEASAHLSQIIVSSTREVFMPMLSSVLTTCSVFIPLIFLSGTAGSLFYDQAMGVTIALFASLLVASLVVPVYYFALFRKNTTIKTNDNSKRSDRINDWLTKAYERGMSLVFRHQKTVILGFVASVVLITVVFPFMRKERMPQISHDDTLLYIDWNSGITPEENDRRMREILGSVSKSLEASTTMSGVQDFMLPHTRDITGSEAVCYMKTKSAESLDSVKHIISSFVSTHYPDAKVEYGIAASVFDMIFSTDMPDLEIRLQMKEGGRPSVDEVQAVTDSLRSHFPHLGIQPVSTEANIRFAAEPEQMAYYKVTYQQLYGRIKELLSSNRIYEISSGGESVPVKIGYGEQKTGSTEDDASFYNMAFGMNGMDMDESMQLLSNTITNNEGVDIPLHYLLTQSRGEDFKRLSAGTEGEYAPIKIDHANDNEIKDIIKYVKELETDSEKSLGKAFKASFTGNYFASRDMVGELAMVLLVAVLLLYFILAAQFESLVQPGIILAEIAIDACIVMLVLFAFGESLNLMSMIGLVVMSGIIINDSILKVDTINNLKRQENVSLLRAIMMAGHRRLKPIVMTSLTTILAIIPFLHRGDMGSALQFPLSLTLIVGMAAGTLVSLYFVPLMYYIIYREKSA